MSISYAASAVVDGRIVAALNDEILPQIMTEDGIVISVSVGKGDGILKTKRELLDDCGISHYGFDNNGDGIVKEWYIQSAEFSKYVVDKTADEVKNLESQLVNGRYISTDEDLLSAGCTIQITGLQAVVVKAINTAD